MGGPWGGVGYWKVYKKVNPACKRFKNHNTSPRKPKSPYYRGQDKLSKKQILQQDKIDIKSKQKVIRKIDNKVMLY